MLTGLDALERWPDKVQADAAQLDRQVRGADAALGADAGTAPEGFSELEIYTTRPDTLFGASFMAIAPDHPLARAAAARDEKLAAFCDECRRMGTSVAVLETAEKMGYDTGIRAVIHSTRTGPSRSMSRTSS